MLSLEVEETMSQTTAETKTDDDESEHPVDELIDRIEECKRAFLTKRDINPELLRSEIGLNIYGILEEMADVFSGWVGAIDDSLSKVEDKPSIDDIKAANEIRDQVIQVGNLTAKLLEIVKTKLSSDEEAMSVAKQLESILETNTNKA